MKLAIDVQYKATSAIIAGILFLDWNSDEMSRIFVKKITPIAPYESGAFYKRELPCILSLLEEIKENLDVIIIDGFVTLGEEQSEGLGSHLYRALNQSIPIIGVAKNPFKKTPKIFEVYRGESLKPLFVTSIGIELAKAKSLIKTMHGKYRNPTLLKKVDQICRGIEIKKHA